MKDLTSTSFGYLIGFVLPGIFGVYALSGLFPQASILLQPMLNADASVGPSVMLFVIAVGIGVIVGAMRFFVFEKLLYRKYRLPEKLYRGLSEERLTLHKALAEEHYRYHQFYGGCFVAGLIWLPGWLRVHWVLDWQLAYVMLGFVLFELLLERSAFDAFKKYVQKCNDAIAGAPAGNQSD
jgi:hypothetical protein